MIRIDKVVRLEIEGGKNLFCFREARIEFHQGCVHAIESVLQIGYFFVLAF